MPFPEQESNAIVWMSPSAVIEAVVFRAPNIEVSFRITIIIPASSIAKQAILLESCIWRAKRSVCALVTDYDLDFGNSVAEKHSKHEVPKVQKVLTSHRQRDSNHEHEGRYIWEGNGQRTERADVISTSNKRVLVLMLQSTHIGKADSADSSCDAGRTGASELSKPTQIGDQ